MTIYAGDALKHVFLWMSGLLRYIREGLQNKLWIYIVWVSILGLPVCSAEFNTKKFYWGSSPNAAFSYEYVFCASL